MQFKAELVKMILGVVILILLFCGLLFIVVGNYLPKCRQSYTIGIKLPWTLASEENN